MEHSVWAHLVSLMFRALAALLGSPSSVDVRNCRTRVSLFTNRYAFSKDSTVRQHRRRSTSFATAAGGRTSRKCFAERSLSCFPWRNAIKR
ncbi:hypothetical protein BDD12DRAFT_825155 [Trichophaea hybrida]|nr:hypothetical protein BDD12DRAFT_825155 [Trichophaea hybrida]